MQCPPGWQVEHFQFEQFPRMQTIYSDQAYFTHNDTLMELCNDMLVGGVRCVVVKLFPKKHLCMPQNTTSSISFSSHTKNNLFTPHIVIIQYKVAMHYNNTTPNLPAQLARSVDST